MAKRSLEGEQAGGKYRKYLDHQLRKGASKSEKRAARNAQKKASDPTGISETSLAQGIPSILNKTPEI